MLEADVKCSYGILERRNENEYEVDSKTEEVDDKVFRIYRKRLARWCNLTQVARILKVHRQTIYYWIKKGWCKPRRDYRNYPVFTVLDIESLIKWRNTIKSE
ncbi:helix-turn-helix domain-containing protein [Candidatus Omnitrophota bacterium]